jgi:hypothetical protein
MAQVSHFRFSLFLKTVLKNLAMNNLFLRTKQKERHSNRLGPKYSQMWFYGAVSIAKFGA